MILKKATKRGTQINRAIIETEKIYFIYFFQLTRSGIDNSPKLFEVAHMHRCSHSFWLKKLFSFPQPPQSISSHALVSLLKNQRVSPIIRHPSSFSSWQRSATSLLLLVDFASVQVVSRTMKAAKIKNIFIFFVLDCSGLWSQQNSTEDSSNNVDK